MQTMSDMSRFQRRRRIAIALVISLLFLALLFVRSAWGDNEIHEHIEAVGLSFIVLAIVGRMWCTLYIGGKKSAEIVRDGPYSVTRNPLYVFSTLGAAGIGAQTGSLTVAFAFAVLCYLAFLIVIKAEEKYLQKTFGEPYRVYLVQVPRFFPRFSLFRDSDELVVRPDRIYHTLMDGLVFFIAFPLFEFVEYLQGAHILPVLLRLY